MSDTVSPLILKPNANNAVNRPEMTEALRQSIAAKRNVVEKLLADAVAEFGGRGAITFANSMGAEDMVLTDIILSERLPIEIFSLDTGRLPVETYDLIAEVERRYKTRLKLYFPLAENVESYVQQHGINAFYESIDLRKACCHMRKIEPLGRALKGKKAWITGMRAQQAATRNALPVREFDSNNGIEKFNPLADWTEQEVWGYIRNRDIPYNKLHDIFYPSIGCAPCTRAIAMGEDVRAGRWWWEDPTSKECGLHVKK